MDKEYAYRLRQKEAVKGLTKRIEGQIDGGEVGGDKAGKGLEYDPLLESKMGLFERYFSSGQPNWPKIQGLDTREAAKR